MNERAENAGGEGRKAPRRRVGARLCGGGEVERQARFSGPGGGAHGVAGGAWDGIGGARVT